MYVCIQDLRENLKVLQYFMSVKCLIDYIHEVESSISKDVGNDFIEVKQLLQNHGELCYTMEALSQQVATLYIRIQQIHTHAHKFIQIINLQCICDNCSVYRMILTILNVQCMYLYKYVFYIMHVRI